ncbi:3-oxoacyl-ACP synthase [Capnocytophaga sp. G1920]|uniref:3-oxoacyl-ACP synthase n=1 Tax=Capnocytophaga sp. G1920 TaxID=3448875 RepID=UPI003EDC8979
MKTCTIKNNTITLNDSVLFSDKSTSFVDFSKKALKALQMDYPKFFKMDNLSKLAFLAAEVLLRPFSQSEKNSVALVFANRSASLDTDLKHQATISNPHEYYPSPAVFVYTLPNICLGEISIRHQLKTENSFFVFDSYEQAEPFLQQYSQALLAQGKAQSVLMAWVEFLEGDYRAIATLID